jgi:hypothetical protein
MKIIIFILLLHFYSQGNTLTIRRMKPAFLTIVTSVLFIFVCNAQSVGIKYKEMKPLCELADNSSAWQMIFSSISKAKNKVEVLPKEDLRTDSALYEAQIQESTPLGAMIYHCGGILIDEGWIRLLGSGCKKLDRSLPQWNKGKSFTDYGDQAAYLLVADDVLGGLFAINKGGIDKANLDMVYYYGPTSLMWLPIGLDYPQLLSFCFSGDIKNFYEEFYWTGWETDVKKLNGNEVISCYPLLWTRNGHELMQCNRKVVSIQKQWSLYQGENESTASKSKKSNSVRQKENR